MPEIDIDIQEIITYLKELAPSVIAAILILIVGFWIVSNVLKIARKAMEKGKVDKTLRPFLLSLISIVLKILVVVSAASQVGIETTSLIALIGAAGLAIGLALQGSLQNFASGVMVLIFKPYKVGDLISVQGFTGVVQEIQIFNTILIKPDNQKVIVPNSSITGGPITNISGQGKIRVDMVFGVAYDANIDKARQVIQAVADENKLILKDPGVDIFVTEHAASSVNFAVRPWCDPAHYWDVYFYMHEELKKAFDKANIGIPYATYDINIIK